jgi:hypothetical protein
VAAASLVFACNDDPPEEGSAPNAIATTACRWYFECDCDSATDEFTSEENCRLGIASDVQGIIDEANERDLTYQGACVESIVGFFNDVQCAPLVDFLTRPELPAAFDELTRCKMYVGDREPGQSCQGLSNPFYGDDCVRDARCDTGVCRAIEVRKGPGESCAAAQDECEIGLVCMDINGGQDTKCEALPSAGATCKGTADLCDFDTYCDQGSKTCTTLPGPGSECAPSPNVLTQQSCNAVGVCNLATNMCDQAPGGGEPCVVKCSEGFACDMGVCVTAPSAICGIGA